MSYKKSESIETNELCKFGCGNTAKFKNRSGDLTCTQSANSCPVNKLKNSEELKNSYKDGIRLPAKQVYSNLPEDTKNRMNHSKNKRFAEFGIPGKGAFKNALLLERGESCECCKLSEWMGLPITLELEHSDGNRQNNTRENLKLLCPNCHSQTPTWRRSGIEKRGFKVSKYSDKEMIDAIETSKNLNQVLTKLNLRYGSVQTIVKIMTKYKVNFMGS